MIFVGKLRTLQFFTFKFLFIISNDCIGRFLKNKVDSIYNAGFNLWPKI